MNHPDQFDDEDPEPCWECHLPVLGGVCLGPHPTIDWAWAYDAKKIEEPYLAHGERSVLHDALRYGFGPHSVINGLRR